MSTTQTDVATAKYRLDYQAPAFKIPTIDLTFLLDPTETKVTNVMTVQVLEAVPLVLDGAHITLTTVEIDGELVGQDLLTVTDETLTIAPEAWANKNTFVLRIENTLDPSANTALEGLYMSAGCYCTQCEAEGFRRITYSMDRPDILSVYTTTIVADEEQFPQLLSNGNLVSEESVDGGKQKVVWHDPHPKPSYLFALVGGDFDCYEDSYKTTENREVVLKVFVDKGNYQKARFAMESVIHSMRWDEQVYGLAYDLDIYMIVAVDFFNMGAMENKGLNIFNSKYVLADDETATDTDYHHIESIIGHEYFHNWTGNRVTCQDWFQLSLKEGLTVFRDQQFSADMGSPGVNRISHVKTMRTSQFPEDAGPMSHPIRPDKVIEMNNFYTVTVYDKGAEVIRMMHTLLGKEKFRAGMDLYFQRHDGQAVTCDDFVNAMQDASGVDLALFRTWYSQSGTPEVTLEKSYDDASKTLTVTVSQLTPPTPTQADKQVTHIPMSMSILSAEGEPLDLASRCNQIEQGHLINIKSAKQVITFSDVPAGSVPVFFQNFSAPVKVKTQTSEADLIHIVAHSDDAFSRWDAMQSLYSQLVNKHLAGDTISLSDAMLQMFKRLVTQSSNDKSLISELLTVPQSRNLASNYDIIDVEGLENALGEIKQQMANSLKDELVACYHANHTSDYVYNQSAIGERALKNTVLELLTYGNDVVVATLTEEQYANSTNMTDTLGALKAASCCDVLFDKLMSDFESKWISNSLVMDKWFGLHACRDSENTVATLRKLMQHSAFDIKNPNRVSALIRSFASLNWSQFHQTSGAGYELLTDVVKQLNELNPLTAARIITPLLSFKQHTPDLAEKMKVCLQEINDLPNLSKDLYEKVTSALA